MSRLGRASATAVGAAGLVLGALLGAAPSYAGGGSFQHCLDQAMNHDGEPPTCTKVNGVWVASWPDAGGSPGGAGFGVFFAFAVVASIAGFAILVWKVTTARQLARQAGMSPGLATGMTLLTDDGLAATYLASSLRPQPTSPVAPEAPPPTAAPPTATVAVRLAELKSLLDDGIVTQAEYDGRRQAIIDSV